MRFPMTPPLCGGLFPFCLKTDFILGPLGFDLQTFVPGPWQVGPLTYCQTRVLLSIATVLCFVMLDVDEI